MVLACHGSCRGSEVVQAHLLWVQASTSVQSTSRGRATRGHSFPAVCKQNFLGSLGGLSGAGAVITVDFRTADGRPMQYATVKGKGSELEKHPLFTSHDTVMGDVRICPSRLLLFGP